MVEYTGRSCPPLKTNSNSGHSFTWTVTWTTSTPISSMYRETLGGAWETCATRWAAGNTLSSARRVRPEARRPFREAEWRAGSAMHQKWIVGNLTARRCFRGGGGAWGRVWGGRLRFTYNGGFLRDVFNRSKFSDLPIIQLYTLVEDLLNSLGSTRHVFTCIFGA